MHQVISPFGDINFELFSRPSGENMVLMVFTKAEDGQTIAMQFHAAAFVAFADSLGDNATRITDLLARGEKFPLRNAPFPYDWESNPK